MKKIVLTFVSMILVLSAVVAQLPQRPNPPTLVTDLAGVFSPQEQAHLEQKLVDFFAQTSTQIAVVTVPDLGGYDVADYAVKLGHSWGIGSEKFDNGILVLIKPKTNDSSGKVHIAVGYGLEGVVPDITANQVVENELIPRFKENDMFGGVENATNVLIELTKGEYNYQQYAKKGSSKGGGGFIVVFIVLIIIISSFGGRRKGYYSAGGRSSLPFWLAMGLMNGAGRSHSGSFGNFSSGSGSFGGGSSFGGFGGFGGGGFGGGGAGGSW